MEACVCVRVCCRVSQTHCHLSCHSWNFHTRVHDRPKMQKQVGFKRRLEPWQKRVEFKRQLERCHLVHDTHYAKPVQKVPPDVYKRACGKGRAPTRREFTDEEKNRKLKRCQETALRCETKSATEGCMLLLDRLRQHALDDWVATGCAAQKEDAQRQQGQPEPDGLDLGIEWWVVTAPAPSVPERERVVDQISCEI